MAEGRLGVIAEAPQVGVSLPEGLHSARQDMRGCPLLGTSRKLAGQGSWPAANEPSGSEAEAGAPSQNPRANDGLYSTTHGFPGQSPKCIRKTWPGLCRCRANSLLRY